MHLRQMIVGKPRLKKLVLYLAIHPVRLRPRCWLRWCYCFYHKRGKGSVIYRYVRMDLPPFHTFALGRQLVVENFTCLNNAVGDLIIGDHSRIGLYNTIIGPVRIGNHVMLAQHVTITALNHVFDDPTKYIDAQGVETKAIVIEDDVWIGAGAIILPGVTTGRHCVVAAGSVVTASMPAYTVCAGSPAKNIRSYDFEKKEWIKAHLQKKS